MVRIRFPDDESKRRGLGWLAGRYPFKSFQAGDMILPEAALPHLAHEGIHFSVEGPATYEQLIPRAQAV